MAVMQGVDDEPGRKAADIIGAARKRQVPRMTQREAARRAGLSTEGWLKILRTGHGREENVIAMARVVGVEPQVREALGLPPLDANVVQMPARAAGESTEDAALRAFRDAIRDDPRLTVPERQVILTWYHSPDGQALLKAKLAEAQLCRARQG
jgi:lambda repressor-like predicted transcriptional regulator